jgi:nucleoside-diphosphate-sugar epimerase
MKVLVTGGGGFLGGAVLRKLLEQGFTVRSFSRGSYPALAELGVEEFRGDLSDGNAVKTACEGCEAVFHVAAKAGISGRYRDYYAANVEGTLNVLNACKFHGIRKLIFTSSPSVVFNGKDMEGVDESVGYPKRYKAAYPETKAIAERAVLQANGESLATVALRPHLIWGPNDTHLVPGIVKRGKTGALRRIGSEQRLVDFTYIDDAAEAHLLAAERLFAGSPIAGRAFFITQGEPLPLWDFVNHVLSSAGLPEVTKTVSPRIAYAAGIILEALYRILPLRGDPRLTRFLVEELSTAHWFDISAARNELSYAPKTSMREGFVRLREWFRSESSPALLR